MRRETTALLSLLCVACGAKSGLTVPSGPDAGLLDARPPSEVGLPDVPRRDAPGADVPECGSDADCDDALSCTGDRCEGGVCVIVPQDTVCDDGRACNGAERCDPASATRDVRGCSAGAPPTCDDGVSCTVDRCDAFVDTCVNEPDVSLCPISHRCDPVRSCVARALVHDPSFLYEIDLPSGDLNLLAPLPVGLTDLALHPDGTLYGSGGGVLYDVDYLAGSASVVATIGVGSFNALDFSPDGTLYGAIDERVVRIDIVSGTSRDAALFPAPLVTSGDLAFVDGRLYATATRDPFGSDPDLLIEVELGSGRSRVVGSIGARCVWGLAPFGDALYGLSCEGVLLTIDTATGAGTVLRTGSASFWGAGAR